MFSQFYSKVSFRWTNVYIDGMPTRLAGCRPGQFYDDGITACVDCEPGTYQPANMNEQDPTVCMLCPDGTYQPDSGQPDCMTCPSTAPTSSADRTSCSGEYYKKNCLKRPLKNRQKRS